MGGGGGGLRSELLMYECSCGICRSTKNFCTVLSKIVNPSRNLLVFPADLL